MAKFKLLIVINAHPLNKRLKCEQPAEQAKQEGWGVTVA